MKMTHLVRHTVWIKVATVDGEVLRATWFVKIDTYDISCKPLFNKCNVKPLTQETYKAVEQIKDTHLSTLHGLSLTDGFHVPTTLKGN
jgi:hypothetical protein